MTLLLPALALTVGAGGLFYNAISTSKAPDPPKVGARTAPAPLRDDTFQTRWADAPLPTIRVATETITPPPEAAAG
jgi:hypothetical protein